MPSSWWIVLLLERKRGPVHPARKMAKERKFRALSPPFMLPRKIPRAEWDKSSSLGENMQRVHNGQINLRAIQKFSLLSATVVSSSQEGNGYYCWTVWPFEFLIFIPVNLNSFESFEILNDIRFIWLNSFPLFCSFGIFVSKKENISHVFDVVNPFCSNWVLTKWTNLAIFQGFFFLPQVYL